MFKEVLPKILPKRIIYKNKKRQTIKAKVIKHILYDIEFIILPSSKKQKKKNVIIVDNHWLFYYSRFEESKIKEVLEHLERIARIDKEELVKFLSKQLEIDILTVQLGLFDIYVVTKDDKLIPSAF